MDEVRFAGLDGRECGEHRTTGRRAWCHDCTEWCYPDAPCKGCELPQLRARVAELVTENAAQRRAIDQLRDELQIGCGGEPDDTLIPHGTVLDELARAAGRFGSTTALGASFDPPATVEAGGCIWPMLTAEGVSLVGIYNASGSLTVTYRLGEDGTYRPDQPTPKD
jgi:hypothetical protein